MFEKRINHNRYFYSIVFCVIALTKTIYDSVLINGATHYLCAHHETYLAHVIAKIEGHTQS